MRVYVVTKRLCSLSLSLLTSLVTSKLVLLMSQSLLMARSRKCGKIRTGLHLDMWSVKSDIYLTNLYRSFIVSQTHYFYQPSNTFDLTAELFNYFHSELECFIRSKARKLFPWVDLVYL